MLLIHIGPFFLFTRITMDSSNVDSNSKASAFNKFKCLLYKYYNRFSKISIIGEHSKSIFVFFYDCVPD